MRVGGRRLSYSSAIRRINVYSTDNESMSWVWTSELLANDSFMFHAIWENPFWIFSFKSTRNSHKQLIDVLLASWGCTMYSREGIAPSGTLATPSGKNKTVPETLDISLIFWRSWVPYDWRQLMKYRPGIIPTHRSWFIAAKVADDRA